MGGYKWQSDKLATFFFPFSKLLKIKDLIFNKDIGSVKDLYVCMCVYVCVCVCVCSFDSCLPNVGYLGCVSLYFVLIDVDIDCSSPSGRA